MYAGDERHGEIRCIQNMIDAIIFVRRVAEVFLNRVDRRLGGGDGFIVMNEIMTAIANLGSPRRRFKGVAVRSDGMIWQTHVCCSDQRNPR